jgi:glycerol uptake facilitator-like aquaporin
MATTKSKKTTAKKSSTKPKAAASKSVKTVKTEAAVVEKPISSTKKSGNPFKGFFAKKVTPYNDPNENILTIFKTPKIWGGILGEVIGTMLLTMVFLTIGLYQPLYVLIAMIAITMVVYSLSGAHLNPINTVGMMATRRISAIRGILYIVAQVVGAWFGLLIINGFRTAGGSAVDLPTITALESTTVWSNIFIELIGAIIISFFFSRAQSYRTERGVFQYAALVAGGYILAILLGIIISSNLMQLSNNFVMNPAAAIMYQIFPTTADNFGALMGDAALACAVYILVPMIGGVLGFFLSDFAKDLSKEN